MSEPDSDWKERALADFRRWLDDAAPLPDAGTESAAAEPPEPDLHTLFAEFTALRQEVRLQNREQSRAVRDLGKAAEGYEAAARLVQRREDDLAAFETRVVREAENRCLRSVLGVRDALVRGRDEAVRLRDRGGLFGRRPRGIAGVVEGYELALRRFDRALAGYGAESVKTAGQPFDSRTMHAVEMRRTGHAGDGVVVEELLGGFTRDGEVLRLAEVAVNRFERRE